MPETVKSIVEQIFALEASTLRAYREEDPTHFNTLLAQLAAYSPDPAIRFGFTPRLGKLDDFETAMFAEAPTAVRPRHVYKISTYPTPEASAYAVFVSAQNPPPESFRLSEVYWLVHPAPTGNPQIIAFHQRDEQAVDGPSWRLAAGIPPADFGATAPQTIDRYLAPDADSWSLAQYRAVI